MFFDHIETPVGWLKIEASDIGLKAIRFVEKADTSRLPNQHTTECKQQIEEYFDRKRKYFFLAFDLEDHTYFHRSVWNELNQIPYGKTISYMDLANKLKNPKAVRAIGSANGKNPLPIVIPCHRVIGSDGSLTGYSGGLHIKQKLLMHENPMVFGQQGKLGF